MAAFKSAVILPSWNESNQDSVDIVLKPKVVDFTQRKGMLVWQKQETLILMEWTASTPAGRPIWMQTIQGIGEEATGNAFTGKRNENKTVQGALSNLFKNSLEAILNSEEIRRFSEGK